MPKQQGSKQLSTLWQLEQLPEFLQESTFENPKVFSGSAFNSLLKAHPQFNRNWYFNSANQTNVKAHLSSLSGYPLTINREIHLILNFSVNYQQNEILGGIISSRQLTDFSVYEISQETDEEKINIVTKFINGSGLFSGPLKSVYRFGDNTLLIQWQDENLGIRFERPYAIMLSENDGKLLLYKNVPTISSYAMQSGEYSENLKYIAAYDLNGDSLPETQFRYEGRYSASDSFYSFTKEGVFNCGEMILGSD